MTDWNDLLGTRHMARFWLNYIFLRYVTTGVNQFEVCLCKVT